jgi:hypothetical protein
LPEFGNKPLRRNDKSKICVFLLPTVSLCLPLRLVTQVAAAGKTNRGGGRESADKYFKKFRKK